MLRGVRSILRRRVRAPRLPAPRGRGGAGTGGRTRRGPRRIARAHHRGGSSFRLGHHPREFLPGRRAIIVRVERRCAHRHHRVCWVVGGVVVRGVVVRGSLLLFATVPRVDDARILPRRHDLRPDMGGFVRGAPAGRDVRPLVAACGGIRGRGGGEEERERERKRGGGGEK